MDSVVAAVHKAAVAAEHTAEAAVADHKAAVEPVRMETEEPVHKAAEQTAVADHKAAVG